MQLYPQRMRTCTLKKWEVKLTRSWRARIWVRDRRRTSSIRSRLSTCYGVQIKSSTSGKLNIRLSSVSISMRRKKPSLLKRPKSCLLNNVAQKGTHRIRVLNKRCLMLSTKSVYWSPLSKPFRLRSQLPHPKSRYIHRSTMVMYFMAHKMQAKPPTWRVMEWESSKHLGPPFIRKTTRPLRFPSRKMMRSSMIKLDFLKGMKLAINLENRTESCMRRMAMWCLRQCLLMKLIRKNKALITGLDKHSQFQDKGKETTTRMGPNLLYSLA